MHTVCDEVDVQKIQPNSYNDDNRNELIMFGLLHAYRSFITIPEILTRKLK